jgi:TolB-like protein/DNA-binding winged helix-turn-helix (wHTH) protein/Tfp pilus assembly protein PilF
MGNEINQLLEFGPFRLDPEQRLLLRDQQPILLSPKAFDLLLVLVQRSGKIVLKDDLMKILWPDTFVEESNLGQHIFQIRKALADKSQGSPQYIVTVPGRGYRFAEEVRVVDELQIADDDTLIVEHHTRSQVVVDGVALQGPTLALPAGRRAIGRSAAVAVIAGLMVVAGYFVWRHYRFVNSANPERIMLAVLPFQNLTGNPDQEYFADGLTEEMITKLGRLHPEQLGVIARTSVMGYKHADKRLDQIGRELSVQYVLEGSFRRTADRLRITAQLIRVKDQTHLWAEEYDRQPQDILSVQDDVAAVVAQEIRLRLTPQQRLELNSARKVNPEAHEAYLKGRFFWNKRTEDGFRKAVQYFETAITKDPNYAQAYAGLADAYILLAGYGFETENDAMPKAREAALQALSIDDRMAEAYTSLGLIAFQYEWKWAEAEKNYKRALELDPNYSVAHHWYGSAYLAGLPGKTDDVIAELRKAQELDPLSLGISTDLAMWLCFAGRFDEGLSRFQEILKVDPDFIEAHFHLSEAYELRGMYPQALAELEKITPQNVPSYITKEFGRIYALEGKRSEALATITQLQRLSEQRYVDPSHIAAIYLALGEKDSAFLWLQKAYEQHSPALDGLKTSWYYDSIRSDPRYAELVKQVGIP